MQQRLFEITLLLCRQNHTTAGELARRFGVSPRTIYRDIDALSLAGVPVYTQPGKGGGIHLMPGYVLDKTLFTKTEQAELLARLEGLAALGAPDGDELLHKLGGLFGPGDAWLQVDFAPWSGGDAMRQQFRLLKDAILQRRLVCFHYASSTSSAGHRTVEPYRLLFRGQGWYLHAYCHTRNDFRYFKLSRMDAVQLCDERFAPRLLPEEEPAAPPPASLLPVMLRFSPRVAFRIMDEFPPEDVQPQEDGSLLVCAHFPQDGHWLHSYILSFGAEVEVIQPTSLRRQVAQLLQSALQLYKSVDPSNTDT